MRTDQNVLTKIVYSEGLEHKKVAAKIEQRNKTVIHGQQMHTGHLPFTLSTTLTHMKAQHKLASIKFVLATCTRLASDLLRHELITQSEIRTAF